MTVSLHLDLLIKYLRPQARGMLTLAVFLAGGILLTLAGPQVIRYFLDTALAGAAFRTLLLAALGYVALSLGQQGLILASLYTAGNVGWRATNLLRADLVHHCLRLDMDFHKQHTPGELIERLDGDVSELANFFSRFVIDILAHALLVLGILVMLYLEDLRAGLLLSVYVAVVLALLGSLQRLATARWSAARQASADQYGFIEERISGAEEIRAAGAESYVLAQLFERMRRFTRASRSAWLVASITANATNLLSAVGLAAGLGIGVYLYLNGEASLGTTYLIVAYVGMLSAPLQQIRRQVQDLQRAGASVQRIQDLLHLQPLVQDPPLAGAQPLPASPPGVRFENVSFAYENGSPVLHSVSFDLAPGRVLGILGRTGSGKTTLTRLLFRLYDPTAGQIRLGGAPLQELPLDQLRAAVGMVTQDVQLFHANLRNNLAFFDRRITDEQIQHALAQLDLQTWVERLPGGLDTLLSGGGQGFSAGEAQLLAFTRVFLKDPGLVILDEASSRLDPVSEALLDQAVARLFAGRTGLIIAHRLATVQRADDILILEAGRVVEFGSRQELAANPGSRFSALLRTGLAEVLE
jgi:ATP-binding cassette, subfamily B, bacterial